MQTHTYIINEMYNNKTIFLQSVYLLEIAQFNFFLKRFSYKHMYSSETQKNKNKMNDIQYILDDL